MSKRHAHAVARIQPLHLGHTAVFNRMNENFDTWSVGIGSTGRHNEPSNPWTQVDRTTMLRNVYGNRVKVIPLQDIGAEQGSNSWCDYVLQKAQAMNLPEITDYFTGSKQDALWYKGRFYNEIFHKEPLEEHYVDGTLRKLHIIDRNSFIVSATEVRGYLQLRSDEWKKLTPAVNHTLIETTYPERFKIVL